METDKEQDIQNFLEKFPPNNVKPVSDDLIQKYTNVFPQILLDFWRNHSFGTYGDGIIQFINPDDYRENLYEWLLREDDGTRIPFAISAFGDIFYWRHIHNPEPTEYIPEWVFDVAYIDPHTSDTGVCAYTMGEFLGEYLLDDEILDHFMRKFHSGFVIGAMEDDLNGENPGKSTLFHRAIKKLGILQPDEMYYFTPALRLGGTDDIEWLDKGNAPVHLDFLYQLAMGDNYSNDDSFYTILDELEEQPSKYDEKIAEIEAELQQENSAEKHLLIARLLADYPYYSPEIQNQELVEKRVGEKAIFHFNEAKKLNPENSGIYYHSFQFYHQNFDAGNYNLAISDLENYKKFGGDENYYLEGKLDLENLMGNDSEVENLGNQLFDNTGDCRHLMTVGHYYSYKEKNEKAIEWFDKVYESTYDFYERKIAVSAKANCLIELDRRDEADQLFEDFQQAYPESLSQIYYDRAESFITDYKNENRYQKAIEYFQKALNANQLGEYEEANAHSRISMCYEQTGDFESALDEINKAIELNNHEYYFVKSKSKLLYKMGSEAEAEETAKSFQPNFGYENENALKIFDENNWQEIVWSLEQSVPAFDRKIASLQEELSTDPTNVEKHFLLAKICELYPFHETENYEEALRKFAKIGYEHFNKAVELDSANPIYRFHRAEFLYGFGYQINMEYDDYKETMRKDYEFFTENSENPLDGYDGLKRMALYEDDYPGIIKYAKLISEISPNDTYNLLNLADAYRKSERYPEAMQTYQEMILANDDFNVVLPAKQGLAETYIAMGEDERAKNLMQELESNGKDAEEKADVNSRTASAFYNAGKYAEAIEFQQKAVEFSKNLREEISYLYPSNLYDLSSYQQMNGDLVGAINSMKSACNANEESYYFTRLGELLIENNQKSDAKIYLQKALELDPDDEYAKELLDKTGKGFFGKWF